MHALAARAEARGVRRSAFIGIEFFGINSNLADRVRTLGLKNSGDDLFSKSRANSGVMIRSNYPD